VTPFDPYAYPKQTEVFDMAFQTACVVDNRDAQEMFVYLEARVDSMKRRIKELERQNEVLRQALESESDLKQSA
jgi:deoxyadenosine/deoxycytidine kinase